MMFPTFPTPAKWRSKRIFSLESNSFVKIEQEVFSIISKLFLSGLFHFSPYSTPYPVWLFRSSVQSFPWFFSRLTLSSHIGRPPGNNFFNCVDFYQCCWSSNLGHCFLLALIVRIFLLGVKVKPKIQINNAQCTCSCLSS